MKPFDKLRGRAQKVFKRLDKAYPEAHCELHFKDSFQLLAATILSAQCTDVAVNKVSPGLFKRYPDAASMAKARLPAIESLIKSIGLYRNKAKSLKGMAQKVHVQHGGKVPSSMQALVNLPGVGRKTANVVLSDGFGLPGLAVDTHVLRVGKRLGLFQSQDPVKVEAALGELMPPKKWGLVSHWLIWHGRRICLARNPRCHQCPVIELCQDPGRYSRPAPKG